MGCQKHIANHIKEQNGHYLLAVKKSQKDLFEDISCALMPINYYLLRKTGDTTTVDLKSESVVFYWLNQLWMKR
jgi:hypothetical protein